MGSTLAANLSASAVTASSAPLRATESLGLPRVTPASLCSRECLPGSCGDESALLLGKCGKQVQNEGVNVWTRTSATRKGHKIEAHGPGPNDRQHTVRSPVTPPIPCERQRPNYQPCLRRALRRYPEGMRPVFDLVVLMHVDLAASLHSLHVPDDRSRTSSTVRKTPTICARSGNRNEGHVPTLEPKREKRDGPSDPVFALRQEIGLDTKRKRENRTEVPLL